jgi:hypothetical protein
VQRLIDLGGPRERCQSQIRELRVGAPIAESQRHGGRVAIARRHARRKITFIGGRRVTHPALEKKVPRSGTDDPWVACVQERTAHVGAQSGNFVYGRGTSPACIQSGGY